MPGIRSSNIYVFDTAADPRQPTLHKTIEAAELAEKAGYSRPHTLHCGPDGVFMTCLGAGEGDDGPGGIALLDHSTFDVIGRVGEGTRPAVPRLRRLVAPAAEHADQQRVGHPGDDRGRPRPRSCCSANKYGHSIHFWDLAAGTHAQQVDLGAQHQMALELRPSHDPEATWGFVGVVVSTEDLSASVFRWHRDGDRWRADKVITIPAEPADADVLPPALKPFGAVPPLVTDIDLSVDDRFLYVSCWGTGELKQYDVSDPAQPREVGSVHLGGIVRRTAHPSAPDLPLAGGPQMVEVSRDGRRVYFTNSLYGSWDDQFYPDGVGAWMAKLDVDPGGGMSLDQRFFPHRRRVPRPTCAPGPPAGRRRVVGLLLLPVTHRPRKPARGLLGGCRLPDLTSQLAHVCLIGSPLGAACWSGPARRERPCCWCLGSSSVLA